MKGPPQPQLVTLVMRHGGPEHTNVLDDTDTVPVALCHGVRAVHPECFVVRDPVVEYVYISDHDRLSRRPQVLTIEGRILGRNRSVDRRRRMGTGTFRSSGTI